MSTTASVSAGDEGASSRFQILALDGGGAKALFTAYLLARLEEDLGVSIRDSFDLIAGTSAGGIVARVWVRELGGDAQARRVLTLGTPNHGTQVAGAANELVPAGCPTACEQLAPDSELLRGLNAGDETPEGPTFVAVWTTLDELVTPPESAQLDGALNITVQSVCPRSLVRHGELPEEPAVAAIVVATLGAAAPSVPQACPT